MFTTSQLVAHVVGDYLLQSNWMAQNKTRSGLAAVLHAHAYAIPFLFLDPSFPALLVLIWSHFLIDRYRLARYAVWAKEALLAPSRAPLSHPMTATGYDDDVPPHLRDWLFIISDNVLHVIVNALILAYL